MSALQSIDKFCRSPDVVLRKVAGVTLLIPIRGRLADLSRIYTLNEWAEFFWEKLDGTHTVQELVTQALEEFEVDTDTVQRDLSELLENMLEEGLIQPVL